MWGVLRSPYPSLLAIALNTGLVPPLAWIVSRFLPHGLSEGMIIAAAVPCTLASAAVWTRRAGGNDAVALLVTMLTNLACFAVVPAWILVLLGTQVDIDAMAMVNRLLMLVVLPIVLAQCLRRIRPLAFWASDRKRALGTIAQWGILAMVFVGAVKSGNQLRGLEGTAVAAVDWVIMVGGVLAVHALVLAIGRAAALAIGASPADAVAVAFAGSQKTLMVGLDLSIEYAAVFGGLAVLPMVGYHVGQLVLDTLIADRWRGGGKQED
jgi:sodium/bile acid cotransporter 7